MSIILLASVGGYLNTNKTFQLILLLLQKETQSFPFIAQSKNSHLFNVAKQVGFEKSIKKERF